jgi:hypothetical protein
MTGWIAQRSAWPSIARAAKPFYRSRRMAMADTDKFFGSYLPRKIKENPEMVESVAAVIQFDIDGAGCWTVDLKTGLGEVREGPTEDNDCVVSCEKEDWEQLLDDPGSVAMGLLFKGKLKVSNFALAKRLTTILK